jgi:hypothetical protein
MRKPVSLLCITSAVGVLLVLTVASPGQAEPGGNKGHKFHLFGSAFDDIDPENATNEVIRVESSPASGGGAVRFFNPDTQVDDLDNQVQLKYLFEVGKDCTFAFGTPRIQLAIDTDGDGDSNGNAFGYLGDKPFGGLCGNAWRLEDMTNETPKWDLTQFGGGFTTPWSTMETFFAAFPNHEVLSGAIIEDTSVATTLDTYYDNVTLGNVTLNGHSDTAMCRSPQPQPPDFEPRGCSVR